MTKNSRVVELIDEFFSENSVMSSEDYDNLLREVDTIFCDTCRSAISHYQNKKGKGLCNECVMAIQ